MTKERKLNGKLTIDQREYSVNAAIAKKKKSSTWIYTPTLEIIIPRRDNIKLDGTVQFLAGKTLDAVVSVYGVSKDTINMRGKLYKTMANTLTLRNEEHNTIENARQENPQQLILGRLF